jgi:hypothetical protein
MVRVFTNHCIKKVLGKSFSLPLPLNISGIEQYLDAKHGGFPQNVLALFKAGRQDVSDYRLSQIVGYLLEFGGLKLCYNQSNASVDEGGNLFIEVLHQTTTIEIEKGTSSHFAYIKECRRNILELAEWANATWHTEGEEIVLNKLYAYIRSCDKIVEGKFELTLEVNSPFGVVVGFSTHDKPLRVGENVHVRKLEGRNTFRLVYESEYGFDIAEEA